MQIPHPLGFFGTNYSKQALPIPEGVSVEQAIDVLQNSGWAQNTAEGVVDKLGLIGEAKENAKQRWARSLAEGMVRSMEQAGSTRRLPGRSPAPTPATTEPRKRRGRPPAPTPTTAEQGSTVQKQEHRKRPLQEMWEQRSRIFGSSR